MPTRPERRRRERAVRRADGPSGGPILIRPRELIIASLVGGVLLAVFVAFLVLRGGNGDSSANPVPSPLTATTPDEIAIESLARQSVEALPKGEWPLLYDSFSREFQAKCSREQFVAAGEADAQAQGDQLALLRFVRVEDLVFEGDRAKAVIVGEVIGQGEYRIRGGFQKIDGTWKLAPAGGTEDCTSAFDRVVTATP
jgi:hypothetical protein